MKQRYVPLAVARLRAEQRHLSQRPRDNHPNAKDFFRGPRDWNYWMRVRRPAERFV